MTEERPIFRLPLQALPRVDAVKALRAALKTLLRGYHLRCLSVEPEPPTANKEPTNDPQPRGGQHGR
jgi:hypothetical protein